LIALQAKLLLTIWQTADPWLPPASDVFIKRGLHEQKPIRPNTIDGKAPEKPVEKQVLGRLHECRTDVKWRRFRVYLRQALKTLSWRGRSVGRAINSYYRLINAGFILLVFSESSLSSGSGSDDNNPAPREG